MPVSEPITVVREVDYTVCPSPSYMSALRFGEGIKSDSSEPHGSGRGMPHQRKNEAYYQKKWEKWILSRETRDGT